MAAKMPTCGQRGLAVLQYSTYIWQSQAEGALRLSVVKE